MATPFAPFLAELKRRRVFRTLVAYGALVFAVLQAADLLFAVFLLPDVALTWLAVAGFAGTPVVAVLAWAYELTSRGVRRAKNVDEGIRREPVPVGRYLEVLGAVLVVVLVVVMTAGAAGTLNYPSSTDGKVGIAIFPWRTVGQVGPEWSEGAPDLLATALDGTSGLRVVDPWPIWRKLRPRADASPVPPDPPLAEAITREAGAHRFLLGSAVGTGDRVELVLRLYQIGRADPIGSFSIQSAPDGVPDAVREASLRVLTDAWGPLRPRDLPAELDFRATDSPEALQAYLAAKEAMRTGRFDSANVAIDRAVELDPTFALALVEAVQVKSWLLFSLGRPFQGFRELLARIEPFETELTERTLLRLQASRAAVRTDGRAAIEAGRRILEIDPLDYLANVSQEYYRRSLGWQIGALPAGGREEAERIVRLDSTQVPALLVRDWWAVALGDTADVEAQLQRLRPLADDSPIVSREVRALEVLLALEPEGGTGSPPSSLPEAITLLRALRVWDPARCERLLTSWADSPDPALSRLGRGEGLRLAVARGRVRDRELASALAPSGITHLLGQRLRIAADLAGVGNREAATEATRGLMAELPPDSALALSQVREVWWDGWLIGAWHAQAGDTVLARRWIEALGTLSPGGSSEDYRGSLQADIEARLALRRRDTVAALEQARSAFALWSIHTENAFEHYPEPVMRLNLALRYRDAGLADSARVVLYSLASPVTWMGFITARASFEVGELAYAAGEWDEARARYREALGFWEGGGAAVEVFRTRARERLRSLEEILPRVGSALGRGRLLASRSDVARPLGSNQ